MIAERLRQDIEKYPFSHQEILPNRMLTVSIGIASYPDDGTTPSELINYSDRVLYKAKHNGKNNTCCNVNNH